MKWAHNPYFYIVDDDFAEEVLQLYRSKKRQK